MNQTLAFVGAVVILIGIVILIISAFPTSKTKVETKAAFVGFIGPFPFGFGTDKQILYVAIALTAILFVAYITYFFFFRKVF